MKPTLPSEPQYAPFRPDMSQRDVTQIFISDNGRQQLQMLRVADPVTGAIEIQVSQADESIPFRMDTLKP